MRILNIGDIQKYKIECRRCNSIIEFNEYEEKYANIARGYFEQYDYYYINCPLCRQEIKTRGGMADMYKDERIKV